jgi:hypothetical protein
VSVSFTLRQLYLQRKTPQSGSGGCGVRKILVSPAVQPFAIPTELSWLKKKYLYDNYYHYLSLHDR